MKTKNLLVAFNRGIVSKLGLNRIDVDRVALSAETIVNWIPRVLGSMTMRPGIKHIGSMPGPGRLLAFQFNVDQQAMLELTNKKLRVWVDDALITRASVSAAITNGDFTADITTGWTDESTGAAAATWVSGKAVLTGAAGDSAALEQLVTITTSEYSTRHALRVVVARGTVSLRIGTTSNGEEVLGQQDLAEGTHSIGFDPTTDVYVRVSSIDEFGARLDSINVEDSGTLELPAPWAVGDLPGLRWEQSADVIFLACDTYQQRRIERRDNESWSVVKYLSVNGPFGLINVTKTTLTASALSGAVTLTASQPMFRAEHVGGLFRIDSMGQQVSEDIASDPVFTDPIRITGNDDARYFQVKITGTWTGTVTMQWSTSEDGPWTDSGLAGSPWTSNEDETAENKENGQILYYRIGMKSGDYGTGTATCTLTYTSGSITGLARVTNYTDTTTVTASVIKNFGSDEASTDWYESEWSDYRGWPTSVAIHESRLWWAGRDKIWGSETDKYTSFDVEVEGDSGPINRSVGAGPIAKIHWLLALGRLMLGTADNSSDIPAKSLTGNNPLNGRSSSFDEPLTPKNFNLKTVSPRGGFVDRSGERVYELTYDDENGAALDDYGPTDLTQLVPDLNEVGIKYLEVQHKPDMRLHCVREDGQVALMVFDRAEKVMCWVLIDAEPDILDAAVVMGYKEDDVYYVMKRGSNYYIGKWAQERDCRGGALNRQADLYVEYDGALATAMTGLDHLDGEKIVVWADGVDVSTYDDDDVHTGPTVVGGAITLDTAASKVIMGLPYTADFKSSKLSTMEGGAAPSEKRTITNLGLSYAYVHHLGLTYGPTFDDLQDMPQVVAGREVDDDEILENFEDELTPFGGEWSTDARLCLRARAPRPVVLRSAAMDIETSEKS